MSKHPMVIVREALGAADDETTADAARRVVAERDEARAALVALREAALRTSTMMTEEEFAAYRKAKVYNGSPASIVAELHDLAEATPADEAEKT